jgi:AraC-like DNA-binding protein
VYLIGYYGLLRSPFIIGLTDRSSNLEGRMLVFSTRKKYFSSPLTEENSEKILINLKRQIYEKKYFLKGDLKLSELSEFTQIPSYQISQVINEKLNKNFFDFINEYRVEEIKRRMQDEEFENLTLLAIAMDSGFNSKSAFNSAFKKSTGITPTAYKKRYIQKKA